MRPLRRALLCVALLAAPAGAAEPGPFDRAAGAELARRPHWYTNGEARTWQVSRDGQVRGVLFGTLHVAVEDVALLPAPLRLVFDKSADLTTEVALDPSDPAQKQKLDDAVRRVARTVDPAAVARLDAATRMQLQAALPPGMGDGLSLFGLSVMIRMQALGGPPPTSFEDADLMTLARRGNKPVRGLETIDAQVAMLGEPNDADAATALRQALRRRPYERLMMAWVRRHYARGEIAPMAAALVGFMADATELALVERDRGEELADRNARWLPRLDATFARPGTHFVAFGALHMMGDDGMVSLLRAGGWDVVPCPGDVCPPPAPALTR